jgi:hypothetical protein
MASASILTAEELFERGDPSFVDEIRRVVAADELGAFGAKWIKDRRAVAREFLFDYLDRPLNAFRHESLVKRLFKLAEAAGDDAVMARFLVLFDRSVRRTKKQHVVRREHRMLDDRQQAQALLNQWTAEGAENPYLSDSGGRYLVWANWWPKSQRWEREYVPTEAEARALARRWMNEGAKSPTIQDSGGRYTISATWRGEKIRVPSSTQMPRGKKVWEYRDPRTGKMVEFTDLQRLGVSSQEDLNNPHSNARSRLERFRLFSVHTRNYLRRRAWRYFRNLGKEHPKRYVAGVVEALKNYTDNDVKDGLALLDNWGLMHFLFHNSPVVVAKVNGWTLAPGRSLGELTSAPIYDELWAESPRALLDLIRDAKARPVRQWAVRLVRENSKEYLSHLPLEELFALLSHADEEVVMLAAEMLRLAPGLEKLPLDRWLALLETPTPAAIEAVCELMAVHVKPEQLSFEQAVQLAKARPLPVAKLGFSMLQSREPTSEAECRALLTLADAESETLRPSLVFWAWGVLSSSPNFQPDWVLEFLDSRHADVRAEGWTWLQNEARARDDVDLWRKLLESPYDDVRLRLVSELEMRVGAGKHASERLPLDADLLRFLWASVLLNIHRGGRTKPMVVGQIVRRLERRPQEAEHLLLILGAALRSVRGPEWRAGLVGVVQAMERNPEIAPLVEKTFPELRLTEAVTG